MKPTLRERIHLSPDYPAEWVVYDLIGSLKGGAVRQQFFRDLQFLAAKYAVIILDMSRLISLPPSALDNFIRFNQQLRLGNRRLVLTGLPEEIFDHHVRLIDGLGDLQFHRSVEDALEALQRDGSV